MTFENKELFFECLEDDLSYTAAKAESLLKMAGYYLTKNVELSKECIKKAKNLVPELYIYFQN